MNDSLLSTQDQEEALSRVYVRAVAARAGYTTSMEDYDRDGVDIQISAGGSMSPAIDLQLKATINLRNANDGSLRYDLNVCNYRQLRAPTQTPRVLVVLALPRDKERWLTITEDELVLRRCAYWLNLRNKPETNNSETITVPIPGRNIFDVNALRMLMEQSRQGLISS